MVAFTMMLLLVGSRTYAQDVTLHETFDNPDLPGWERSPTVTVADGVLRVPGPDGYALWPEAWNDGVIALRARLTGRGDLVVGYSVTDGGQYELVLNQSGASLRRNAGGTLQELMGIPGGIEPGEWQQIEIHVSGPEHFVALNGQPSLFGHDPEPLPPGGVLLHVEGTATGEFDDLTVIAPEGEAPSGGEAPPTPAATGLPAYQAQSWVRLGGPPGGLGYDIRMQPDNPDIMYVTDANAGIHKSVDGGRSWVPVNAGVAPIVGGGAPVFCATIDPHDANTVWIGTQSTGHLYRSTDGGQTWEARDEGITHTGRSVRGITIDPNDPNIVYAGVEVSSFAWAGHPITHRLDVVMGEVYKSFDAGASWTRIWEGNNLARYVWIDPRNTNRLYVSTGIFDRDAADSDVPAGVWGGVGILRSDDGGQTWTVLNEANGLGGRYIPSLFMHPDNPDVLLAAVSGTADNPGVYVTRNGGDTWERLSVDSHGHGVEAVEIATSDTDVWYAAGEGTIWRSDDAGQTWDEYPIRTAHRAAGIPIDLQVDPRDPYRIFDNNYGGGNFLSEDGGATWVEASRGYTGIKLSSDIGVAPGDGQTVFAGEFRSDDGGLTWAALDTTEIGGYQFPDAGHYLLTDVSGHVWHSQDGGQSCQRVTVLDMYQASLAGLVLDDVPPQRALVVAPGDPQIVYTGFVSHYCLEGIFERCMQPSGGFHRSSDGGYTWEAVPGTPFDDVAILRIAVHPDDSRLVYAATARGLFRSRDGGATWEAVPVATIDWSTLDRDLFADQWDVSIVFDIVFDPFDSQTLYAALIPGAIWRSTDGGQTWQQVSAGMDPNEPIYSILPDPNGPGVLYASSGFSGVFFSTDGAATWQTLTNGLTFSNVRGLALSDDGSVLYAGTVGNGVFRLGTPGGGES
jgi:photosystem II stability/assembly factor-like uncharacterized protein